MAPSTRLMKSSEAMTTAALADLLEALAVRVRSGAVTLTSGTESVTLDLLEQVKVDVEATQEGRRRGTKMELEIEISWYPGKPISGGGLALG